METDMSTIAAEIAQISPDNRPQSASGEAFLKGPLGALLPRLLQELGWQRSDRVLQSAVSERGALSLAGLVQALRRLGYEVTVGEKVPERWDTGIDGALLLVARSGDAEARVRHSGITTRLGPEGLIESGAPSLQAQQYVLVVDTADAAIRQPDPTVSWTPNLRRVTRRAFLLSFFINLLALSVPIFSMEIYDRVIGGNAPEVLPWFGLGTALAITFMLLLRRQRSRLLSGAYARIGYHLSLAVLDRMLRLPLLVAGKLRRASLASRASELERMRARLSTANIAAVFDAPFILLSLLALVFVGGWLALIPIVYLLLFAAIGKWVSNYVLASSRLAGPAIAEREAMLADLAENAPALLSTGAAEGWMHRFLEVSASAVRGGYVQGTRQGLAQATAYVLSTGAALATLVGGLELVLAGVMTPGGLIASMLLIWRITAPAQALFLAIGRLRQADSAKAQVERFFSSPYEGSDATKQTRVRLQLPSLAFERVTYRYNADQEPALAGITFRLEPGELLAVTGPNGAGKTTLLRMAAGLLEPQGGLVTIDDRNIRQFDPDDLRLVLGYHPEHPCTFNGTLADNLLAGVPAATDTEMSAVVAHAWPAELGAHLSDGLATRLPLPASAGRAEEDDHRLGLARLLLRPSPLYLIADPVESAGPEAPQQVKDAVAQLQRFLQAMRGKSTIVLVTQNPALIAMANKALVLEKGQLLHFGPVGPPGRQEETPADNVATRSPS